MSRSESPTGPSRQPTLFIPHGAGPCFFMDWNPPGTWEAMGKFLSGVPESLPQRPRAILVVSAHWQTPGFRVTAARQPQLIYDYYGFPEHTYRLQYPAPGDVTLATQADSLLLDAGLDSQPDSKRGFDHGMFIPLMLMFPEAEIPVVQLSLRADLDPGAHLAAGRALAPLRDQGVLIIGSGMSFHNMRGYGNNRFTAASQAFDEWLTSVLAAEEVQRNAGLADWTQAPCARDCHPPGEEEHLLPLMVAAGAAAADVGRKVYSERVIETQLSAYCFG